jgi:antirestriction protein ArdC
MRAHVERTCEAHSIHVTWTERKAFASFDEERIWIPPIRSAITYATALHEIGHVLGKYKLSKSVLVRERAAWRWARGNALVWTSSMERNRVASLAWYEARSSVV